MPNAGGGDVKFRGAIGAVRAVIHKRGFKGFYRGNIANLCKVNLFASIMSGLRILKNYRLQILEPRYQQIVGTNLSSIIFSCQTNFTARI